LDVEEVVLLVGQDLGYSPASTKAERAGINIVTGRARVRTLVRHAHLNSGPAWNMTFVSLNSAADGPQGIVWIASGTAAVTRHGEVLRRLQHSRATVARVPSSAVLANWMARDCSCEYTSVEVMAVASWSMMHLRHRFGTAAGREGHGFQSPRPSR
jgi:hypothetical protein